MVQDLKKTKHHKQKTPQQTKPTKTLFKIQTFILPKS